MPAVNVREILHLQVVHSPQSDNLWSNQKPVSCNLEALDPSNMIAWYWSDTINMDGQYQRCTYGKGATLLIFKVMITIGLVHRCKDVWTVMRQLKFLTSMAYQIF